MTITPPPSAQQQQQQQQANTRPVQAQPNTGDNGGDPGDTGDRGSRGGAPSTASAASPPMPAALMPPLPPSPRQSELQPPTGPDAESSGASFADALQETVQLACCYYHQLTSGCGRADCNNSDCASNASAAPRTDGEGDATSRAASLAVSRSGQLCENHPAPARAAGDPADDAEVERMLMAELPATNVHLSLPQLARFVGRLLAATRPPVQCLGTMGVSGEGPSACPIDLKRVRQFYMCILARVRAR